MKLQEIFDQLTVGELSQISIGGEPAGTLNSCNYIKILPHINMGITALYKRFPLKQNRLILELTEGITTYQINRNRAASYLKSTETVRYILDTADEPFMDDILKIEQVLTDDNFELSLNDGADIYSVTTPSATTLRVPELIVAGSTDLPTQLQTTQLELVYRANHPRIVKGYANFDPARIDVQLPESHLWPLLLFVASRVHTPIGMTNEFNASNNFYAKYEMACKELEDYNLRVDQGRHNTRLELGGWV